jgi:hypothetical protein
MIFIRDSPEKVKRAARLREFRNGTAIEHARDLLHGALQVLYLLLNVVEAALDHTLERGALQETEQLGTRELREISPSARRAGGFQAIEFSLSQPKYDNTISGILCHHGVCLKREDGDDVQPMAAAGRRQLSLYKSHRMMITWWAAFRRYRHSLTEIRVYG